MAYLESHSTENALSCRYGKKNKDVRGIAQVQRCTKDDNLMQVWISSVSPTDHEQNVNMLLATPLTLKIKWLWRGRGHLLCMSRSSIMQHKAQRQSRQKAIFFKSENLSTFNQEWSPCFWIIMFWTVKSKYTIKEFGDFSIGTSLYLRIEAKNNKMHQL